MNTGEHTLTLIDRGAWAQIAEKIAGSAVNAVIPRSRWKTWGIPEYYTGRVTITGHGATRRVLLATDHKRLHSVIAAVAKQHIGTDILWLLPQADELSLLFHPGTADGRTKRLTLRRDDTHAISLARLEQLFDDRSDAFSRAFDAEEITHRFFFEFRGIYERFAEHIEDGPDTVVARRELALTWLLRVVFLYFLQTKGALDGDRNFLQRNGLGVDTHRRFWRPLFFEILNTPEAQRTKRGKMFGNIAYLNGGLFEPSNLEILHPNASIPDALWRRAIRDVFERYYFVVRERGVHDEVCAIDPEMLGKVFESLMASETRKRSGSFYTPRPMVREIVEGVLSEQLTDQLGLEIRAVTDDELRENRGDVARAIKQLRVLDPAVGTGAFLMASLDFLSELRVRAGLSAGIDAIIRDSLFGVDINPMAIRICELRFWLRILANTDSTSLEPLPNLSHRFVPGNSLIDVVDQRVETSKSFARLAGRFQQLQRDFFRSHGVEKQLARQELEKAQVDVHREILHEARRSAERQKEQLERVLTQEDLFGKPTSFTSAQRLEHADLDRRIRSYTQSIKDLDSGHAAPEFSYATHFPRVVRDGGFDVVVTNPPWVRAHDVEKHQLDLFRRRYETARPDLWETAQSQGVRVGFGGQPDLANLFIERSLELVRPGGRVAALVPSKIFRSLHGTSTRALIAKNSIECLVDSDATSESMFDATTYPARFQIRKGRTRALSTRPQLLFGHDPRAPWHLGDPNIGKLLNRLSEEHRPLGSFPDLSVFRGFFTGCNDVFVRPKGELRKLVGESRYIRRVRVGRSGEFEILLPYKTNGTISHRVSERIEQYFESHRDALEQRSDFDPSSPLWQVFRMRPEHFSRKVCWRDLSVMLEPEPLEPDVVPLNTIYYISAPSVEFEQRLIALLQSPVPQAFARSLCERARGGWRRHFAWSIQCIPIPGKFFASKSCTPRLATIRDWYGITEAEESLLIEHINDSLRVA